MKINLWVELGVRRYLQPLLAIWGVVLAQTPMGAQSAERSDHVVELPMFIVEDSKHPLKWRYASLPGLDVLSTCSRTDTDTFAESFYRVYQAFHLLVPEDLSFQPAVPLTVILLDQKDQAVTKEIAAQIINAERVRVSHSQLADVTDGPLKVTPLMPTNATTRSVGRPPTQELAFFPNMRLSDADSYMMFTLLNPWGFSANGLTLAPEEVSYLLERRMPRLPSWYIDGIKYLYQSAVLRQNGITLPRMTWISRLPAPASANGEPPRPGAHLMELFLSPAPIIMDAVERRDRDILAALFIRWALRTDQLREGLRRFVATTSEARPTPELFRECFGVDSETITFDELATNATRRTEVLKLAERTPKMLSREPAPIEVSRILGDWQRRAATYVRSRQPDIADKYLDQAKRTLQNAYNLGDREPQLLALIAFADCDSHDDASAKPLLEEAIAHSIGRARAYYELARIRYDEALRNRRRADGRLDIGQVESVLSLLREARSHPPQMSEAYVLAANVWKHAAETPGPADREELKNGLRLFPANAALAAAIRPLLDPDSPKP
jgi:hypothetical protein